MMNRTRTEVKIEILKSCIDREMKYTHITQQCRLCSKPAKLTVEELVASRLLTKTFLQSYRNSTSYRTTQKGKRAITVFNKLKQILDGEDEK